MKIFNKYADYYNIIYRDKPYKQEAEFVYRWLGNPCLIVDIGCGTGQHAKYWSKKTKVIGVEKSKDMLARAYKHKNIQYCEKLPKGNKYVYFTAMFNVVGYLWLDTLLKYLPIEKGGFFVFDCWDTNKIKQKLPKIQLKKFKKFQRLMIPEIPFYPFIGFHIVIMGKDILYDEYHDLQSYSFKRIEQLCELYEYKIIAVKDTSTWTRWYKIQKV
jgi:SAM-dependent methyltransferase